MIAILAMVLLVATFLLTLGSLDPLDIAIAVALGVAVLAFLHRPLLSDRRLGPGELLGRIARFPHFALAIVWEITVGTWRVTLVVLGLRPLTRPGIVAIPIGERSRSGVTATALAITLSPGEVFVDVDWDRGVMLIHVLDADDPDAIRARYDDFYERFQRGVFP